MNFRWARSGIPDVERLELVMDGFPHVPLGFVERVEWPWGPEWRVGGLGPVVPPPLMTLDEAKGFVERTHRVESWEVLDGGR